MESKLFKLEIISPEKILFSGEVSVAAFPGEKSPFTVLYNHAPLISSLVAGTISFTADEKENTIDILGGFVEVKNNCVTACVEIK